MLAMPKAGHPGALLILDPDRALVTPYSRASSLVRWLAQATGGAARLGGLVLVVVVDTAVPAVRLSVKNLQSKK